MKTKSFYVYLVKCNDDSLYCGYTNNLEQRVNKHNTGEGAKYTSSRKPVTLVYYEAHNSRSDAMRREAQIKKWRKSKKLNLINNTPAGIV